MNRVFNHRLIDVFKACLKALKQLKMKVDYESLEKGRIEASTRASILSWGESIVIDFESSGDKCSMKVSSEAAAQVFSWGKDSSNEREILNLTEKKLKT
ncbi:MAG: hypothetical protein COA32_09750 [Fluviicola sp.]|nr:MAG: hypothetical protein COA32_09750 [Fluviicola sp.]